MVSAGPPIALLSAAAINWTRVAFCVPSPRHWKGNGEALGNRTGLRYLVQHVCKCSYKTNHKIYISAYKSFVCQDVYAMLVSCLHTHTCEACVPCAVAMAA